MATVPILQRTSDGALILHCEKDTTFEKAYPSEDCGCPVEEWLCCGISIVIHFEEDGTAELFADTGDWDHEFKLTSRTMESAREEAFDWCRSLPSDS